MWDTYLNKFIIYDEISEVEWAKVGVGIPTISVGSEKCQWYGVYKNRNKITGILTFVPMPCEWSQNKYLYRHAATIKKSNTLTA